MAQTQSAYRAFLHGDVEPVVQEILVKRLGPGMVFYDLGANVGFFSLVAARIVGESGQMFSFELDPEIAARLRRNIDRYRIRRTAAGSGIRHDHRNMSKGQRRRQRYRDLRRRN